MNTPEEQQPYKAEEKNYKSPKCKLIKFFENSRDGWKQKSKDTKYQVKLLRKKIKYMEQSKKEYKETINNQAHQIEQMQAEIERLKKNLNL